MQFSSKLLSYVLKQYTIKISENVMGRGPVVPFLFDKMWLDELVFMSDLSLCPSLEPYKNKTLIAQRYTP